MLTVSVLARCTAFVESFQIPYMLVSSYGATHTLVYHLSLTKFISKWPAHTLWGKANH